MMMNYNNKMMFLFLMILSNLMIMFSNYWFNMWIWLEINLISFISIMINKKNNLSFESSLIYFLIQTIASILLLYSMIMSTISKNFYLIMLISLMIKLSMAPFHFWIIIMIENLNWMNILLLLTWQKLSPLILLFLMNKYLYMMVFIIYSMMIGSISGLNLTSLKKILTYSSINQMSWMVYSLMFINMYFKLYYLMYFYMMIMLIYSFNYFKLNYINQLFMMKNKMKILLIFIFMNLLSLGGLPPFLGFLPKMIIIMKMNKSILMFLMIMFSLMNLFYYMRIILSIMMLNSMKINSMNYKYNKKKIMIMLKFSFINNFMLIYMYMYI